ncbi:hypothetical protein DXT89_16115 [Agrobacterium vitis]|uniref:Uncharacterized protein n=1 Tax=Agrobacterium vitis TaxID=373 RepID=A0A368N5G0_AGRVI|nr:hypothetical protein DXM22_15695 [Agrobacterium vitis]KAA3526056.1 hypothetical protein DXT89_16115 [Agrobacterium vitis]RCU45807.1 hypothetical protein ASB66_025465 [Agrobacterium vitis]
MNLPPGEKTKKYRYAIMAERCCVSIEIDQKISEKGFALAKRRHGAATHIAATEIRELAFKAFETLRCGTFGG